MLQNYFESKAPQLITWKFYLFFAVISGSIPLILGIFNHQPLEMIIIGILFFDLVILGFIYCLDFLSKKGEEKDNYILEFDSSEIRITRKNKTFAHPYNLITYRSGSEIIDEEGRYKNLQIDDEKFFEVCESILLLDSKDNGIITCNLGYIDNNEQLLEQIKLKITHWSPKNRLIKEEKIFYYSKIPIISTCSSIIFYFLSLIFILFLIEGDSPILGSLGGALILFIMDSSIFSLFTLICYMTAKPGIIFPISLSSEGILLNNTKSILPWDQVDIFYYGLKGQLQISFQDKSVSLNPNWIKNYKEFSKSIKPYLRVTQFIEKNEDRDAISKRLLIKNWLFSLPRQYKPFFLVSFILLIITSTPLILIPIANSMQANYSNQMIFQNNESITDSWELSSPVNGSYNWSLDFSLAGNIEAYDILWKFKSEYQYFSNFTTGSINYRMILFLNNNSRPVLNRTAYHSISLYNSSKTYSGMSNYKHELNSNLFRQGLNHVEFSLDLYSNILFNNTEEGVFFWNTSALTLSFIAVNTGDGIPEASKTFFGINAYLLEIFTFLSILPFAAVIDMYFQKPKIVQED